MSAAPVRIPETVPYRLLQHAFSTVPLSAGDWLRCIAVASSVLWLRESSKLVARASNRAGDAAWIATGQNERE
ncbi:hypothetical protein [Methylocaldum gracile]